jgi:sugar transferase (PEP-CTERM system associated)
MRLFNVYIPTSVIGLVASDFILLNSAFLIGVYLTSEVAPEVWLLYGDGWSQVLLIVLALMLGIYLQDLYTQVRVTSKTVLVQQFCLVTGAGFLFQALLSYGAPGLVLPRRVMLTASALVLVVMPLWRILYGAMVTSAMTARRVLFLGASDVSREIARRIGDRPEMGLVAAGFVTDDPPAEETTLRAPLLGPLASFLTVVRDVQPDLIVVGMSERRQRLPVGELLDLRFSGVRIEEAATTYENTFGRVCLTEVRPSQLVFSAVMGPRPNVLRMQALYSTAIALAGLIAAAPVIAVIAILVKLTSRGPVLYRQRRVGLNGSIFTLNKFRSMRQDAEAATGAVWATADDPRVTLLGRWLRRLRLDELPQLFNVLKGEMSIVGPRPERPEFVDSLSEKIPFYRQRLCVKPGLTGWAQINHPYTDSLEDTSVKLEYDLYYIKNLTPALDAYIIFHTLKVMLLRRGAR